MDQRLKAIVVNTVDISYGGEQGFNQAIDNSKGLFSNLKLVQEQEIIGAFYENINLETGKIAYGVQDTMNCLADGSCEKLIVWDSLDVLRVETKNKATEEIVVKYFTSKELENIFLKDEEEIEFDIVEEIPLIDWLAENVANCGAELVFVTDQSPEGSQFVAGFGGIGAFLRFAITMDHHHNYEDDADSMEDFI